MRYIFTAFFIFTVGALGAERSFSIRYAEGDGARQELATLVRSELDIRDIQLDNGESALRVAGNEAQVTAAEWLVAEIDKPAARVGAEAHAGSVYRIDGAVDGVLRVFYLKGGRTRQEMQQVVTVMRSIVEIRRLFMYGQTGGIVARGTQEQLDAVEWLVAELDKPSARVSAEAHASSVYRIGGAADGMLRVFYLKEGRTWQKMQEAATVMRSTAEIRRLFVYGQTGGIAVRGTQEQLEAAERVWRTIDNQ